MKPLDETLRQKFEAIKLFVMDVDGVLTNGDIIYTDAGNEIKIFNVKDGHGLAMLAHSGYELAIITGRNSPVNQRRADEIGIAHVFQGVKTKLPVLEDLCKSLDVSLAETAYMGDDTPDMTILNTVGLALCPSDAVDEVKRICHYTTQAPGGKGAVREVADILLEVSGTASKFKPVAQKTS